MSKQHDLHAIRHLLRHLRDADAQIVARVRRGVEALADGGGSNGALEREIVRRCDLEGAEHKVVIADLGMSRRAFYYHRRRSLQRLDDLLRAPVAAVPAVFDRIDEFEIQVNRAASLSALGHLDAALSAANRAESVATTADRRVRARAMLAEYAIEAGHADTLRLHLQRLENEMGLLDRHSRPSDATAWLCGATTAATLRWRIDGANPLTALRTIAAGARGVQHGDAEFVETRARFLMSYADFANIAGAPGQARLALDEAGAVLGNLGDPAAPLRVRLAIAEVVVSLALVNPLSYAADRARAALDVSTRYGLLPYALDASAVLAMTEVARGQFESALDVVRAAAPAALALGRHEAREFFFLSAARVCAGAGSLREARSMLSLAQRQTIESSALAAAQRFTHAVVLLVARRPAAAAASAADTMRLSEHHDLKRMMGRALGLRAQALVAMGRSREARTYAIDAVSVLESHGTQHALASAYELSAALTHNTRHRRQAGELRAVISS